MTGSPPTDGAREVPDAPRRSPRRLFKRLVVSVALSLALVFGWRFTQREWVSRDGERELAAAVADAERSDPDWSWERLNAVRKRPPAGQNAAELIPKIRALSHPEWGKRLTEPGWIERLDPPPNVRFSPAVLAVARRDLDASGEAVRLAQTLKDYPNGHREIVLGSLVINTLIEDTQQTRHTADLLRWDIVVAIEDGDARRSTDDLRALLNASRSIGNEPFLISQLVRIAVRAVMIRQAERVLAQTDRASELAGLQLALDVDAEEPLLLYCVRGERAAYDRLFENLRTGTATLHEVLGGPPGWRTRAAEYAYRPKLPADHAETLRQTTAMVELARLPIHEQPPRFAALPALPDDGRAPVTRALLSSCDVMAQASWRSAADARCAVAGIACERFRQKHGRWPDTLTELVPAFIPAVPLDPFGGEALRYVKPADGAVVYSVGKRPPSEFGRQPPVRPGLPDGVEIGFRLWNPDQRRLPAPPDPVEHPPDP